MNNTKTGEQVEKKKRGFAAMDPARVKEIASKGGKEAHARGTGHRFTQEEARVAGRKGGLAPHVRRDGNRKKDMAVAVPNVPRFPEPESGSAVVAGG